MFLKKIYTKLATKEESGKRIGLFRVLSAIFGGLLAAYLGMTLLIFIIPGSAGESIIVPLMFNTMVWAIFALFISLAPSKLSALFRFMIPSIFFALCLIILF